MEGIAVARTVGRRPRNPLKYHYNLKRLKVIIVGAKFQLKVGKFPILEDTLPLVAIDTVFEQCGF